MKIVLVFDEWLKKESVGLESPPPLDNAEARALTSGEFHAGSFFEAEIHLAPEDEQAMKDAMARGYVPTFWLSTKTRTLKTCMNKG